MALFYADRDDGDHGLHELVHVATLYGPGLLLPTPDGPAGPGSRSPGITLYPPLPSSFPARRLVTSVKPYSRGLRNTEARIQEKADMRDRKGYKGPALGLLLLAASTLVGQDAVAAASPI